MRPKGFTLIEVVITLAVLAILMVLMIPSFSTWFDGARIRNTAASLQNGLQIARSEAIKRNLDVTLWLVSTNSSGQMDNTCALSSSSGSWVVSILSPATACATQPSETPTASPYLLAQSTTSDSGGAVLVSAVDSAGTAANAVTFNSYGRVDTANPVLGTSSPISRIDVTGPGSGPYRNLRVLVSSTGQISLCDPSITDATDPHVCPSSPQTP